MEEIQEISAISQGIINNTLYTSLYFTALAALEFSGNVVSQSALAGRQCY